MNSQIVYIMQRYTWLRPCPRLRLCEMSGVSRSTDARTTLLGMSICIKNVATYIEVIILNSSHVREVGMDTIPV